MPLFRPSFLMSLSLLMAVISAVQASPEVDTRGGRITLELVSEVDAIQPGQTFQVGLRITHEKGWHTYWRHPGIVGVPTSLEWSLPDGFEAGEIQWPVPERVKMTVLTAWGYEKDVLLMIPITAPDTLAPDTNVTLSAKGTWMACAETCHPGWGEFSITLPVTDRDTPVWNEHWKPLFDQEEQDLPRDLKGWEVSAERTGEREIRLRLSSEEGAISPNADLYFFSFDDQVHSDEPQVLRKDEDGSLTLTIKQPQFAPKDPESLSGLLYLAGGWPELDGEPFARVSIPW